MMRDKINWTWKRIVGTVLGILGIGTLTSCYGVYDDDLGYNDNSYHDVFGSVTGTLNGEKQPVENISVSLQKKHKSLDSNPDSYDSPSFTSTGKTGGFHFYSLSDGEYRLCFTDIDKDENGSFKQQYKEFALDKKDIKLSVELENAE